MDAQTRRRSPQATRAEIIDMAIEVAAEKGALGFTLDEIHEYLDLYDADPTQRTQVAVLLGKVRARIAALESQKAALDQTLAELRDIEGQAEAALNQTEDTPA